MSTNSGKGCTSPKCSEAQNKEHLSFTEEQRELGLESRKDKGVKEREYSSGGELGATGNSCKADQLFLIRPCLVAGTQPLLTSSRGFFANPPHCLSPLGLTSLARAFSLRRTECFQSPRVGGDRAEIRI